MESDGLALGRECEVQVTTLPEIPRDRLQPLIAAATTPGTFIQLG
jgi:hypothetical protein